MDRATERLNLGRSTVLSVTRAASLLPMRQEWARAAIRAAGIVRRVGAKDVVTWADVEDYVLVRQPGHPATRDEQ